MPEAASESQIHGMRDAARTIFLEALSQASITRGFERHVQYERGVLRICEDLYDLNSYSRVLAISLGKAAHTMVEGLTSQVGSTVEGLVASSVMPDSQVHGYRYFCGGHPTPNAESVAAASAMLRAAEAQPASALVIFLISGGGSSIVESPVDDEISLDDLIKTYRVLVHSGAPIAEINVVRKHLSAVKGGRLAQAASPAQQVSILVSDVPDSTPDALASGPSMPDSSSVEDCYRIAENTNYWISFRPQHESCLRVAPWKRRQSPMIRRFTNHAGGRFFRTRVRSMRRVLPPNARVLSCMWTIPATIGTTSKQLIICWQRCENSGSNAYRSV